MSTVNVTPETDTPTSHTADAQARVEDIRAMRQKIPNFTIPQSKRSGQQIASVASLPPAFVELSAVAISNSASLVRGGAADPERIRDLMTFGDAYAPLADELEAMASFVRHSVAAARNEAGREALTTYALAQRLPNSPLPPISPRTSPTCATPSASADGKAKPRPQRRQRQLPFP